MEFINAEVFKFGIEGGAPIMAKDHPALKELLKVNAGEPLSPVLCLALFKDSQHCHFYMQMGCGSRRTPPRSLFWVK